MALAVMGCARACRAAHTPPQGTEWDGQRREAKGALGGDPETDCGRLRRQEVARVAAGIWHEAVGVTHQSWGEPRAEH